MTPCSCTAVERLGYVRRGPHRVIEVKLLFTPQPIPERLSLDVGLGVVEAAVCLPGVMERQDVRICSDYCRPSALTCWACSTFRSEWDRTYDGSHDRSCSSARPGRSSRIDAPVPPTDTT